MSNTFYRLFFVVLYIYSIIGVLGWVMGLGLYVF